MPRSIKKSSDYFDSYIKSKSDSLVLFRNKLESSPNLEQEDEERISRFILMFNLRKLIAMYSRGSSVDSLKLELPQLASDFKKAQSFVENYEDDFELLETYVDYLWLVSLGILINDSNWVFENLKFQPHPTKDFLLDFFLEKQQKSDDRVVFHQKQFSLLQSAIIESPDKSQEKIQEFLEGYYQSMNKTYWYGSHKSDSNSFFGYWCFEAAAVVKVCNFDDSSFRNHPLYPRDLVSS